MPTVIKPKPIKIDADVIGLLRTGTWSETSQGDPTLTMPLTKDRKLYEKTAKVLTTLGGKWNKKEKATVFDDNDAETAVHEACESGTYINAKQLYQFFETPDQLADRLVDNLAMKPDLDYTILEPSAGNGALIRAVARANTGEGVYTVIANELDTAHQKTLEELTGSPSQVLKSVLFRDFMTIIPQPDYDLFDRVLMNPPFTQGQDMAHIRHAYKFLKPGGILVSVLSPAFTFRTNKATVAFREWLDDGSQHTSVIPTPLPEGSFRVSGTNVRTYMLVIHKRK